MLPDSASTAVQRIALVATSGCTLADLAGPLVERLVAMRHKPICLARDLDAASGDSLSRAGAVVGTLVLPVGGLNPVSEFRARRHAGAAFAAHRPHAILAYDLAAASMIAPLAHRAKCRRVVAVLPSIEVQETDKGISVQPTAERQLRQLMTSATDLVVPTAGDARVLKSLEFFGVASIQISPQRGIDVRTVASAAMPRTADAVVFATAACDLEAKDVEALLAAMARVVGEAPQTRLVICGDFRGDVDHAAIATLIAKAPSVTWNADGCALAEAIARAHAYIHPRVAAGVTGGLLTALAVGRPMVVTNVAGARETVDEVVNGILARPGEVAPLADAMLSLVRRADLLAAMGEASRRKAERRFDATVVNASLLGALGIPVALGSVA